jgi:GTP-binding protein EngB required for normal cell division
MSAPAADNPAQNGVGVLDAVERVCRQLAEEARSAPVRDGARAISQRLKEPLRVALAGVTDTGKSTLANALLGVSAAPTAAGECTQVVTWYRFGDQDQATAVLRTGERLALTLGDDRALPETLPVPAAEVELLDVRLYCSALRRLTLVDTPGLSSLSADLSDRTAALLTARSRQAAQAADALVYVITRQVREDDRKAIEMFAAETHALRASAANAVLVLNKADKLAENGGDPAVVCERLIAHARSKLGPALTAAVPLIGLLAETSACGRLTERVARTIREMAALPPDRRRALSRLARDPHTEHDPQRRDWLRTLRLLDTFGLRYCLQAADAGQVGAGELTRLCERLSGLGQLQTILFERFASRAGVLKADSAMAALRGLVRDAPLSERQLVSAALRQGADELMLARESRDLRVLRLLHEVLSGRLNLPDERVGDITRWLDGSGPGARVNRSDTDTGQQLRRATMSLAADWRAYGNDPRRDGPQRTAAQVMTAAYATQAQEMS